MRRLSTFLTFLLPALSALTGFSNAFADLKSASDAFAAGEFEKANAAYHEILSADPDNIKALSGAGHIALLSNKLTEAESMLRKAIRLDPGNQGSRADLAETLYRRDQFVEVASYLDETKSPGMIRKLKSFAGQTPYQLKSSVDSTVISFANLDPLPAIEVRIGDHEPVFFLIDTGGGELILDQEYAKEVKAETFGEDSSTFAGGSKASFQHGRIDSLHIGDFQLRNIPVHIMNTRLFSAAAGGKRIDGIIGTVLLYHFCATLDYPAQKLALRRKEICRQKQDNKTNTITVPFWMAGDHIIVTPGKVNNVSTMLFVDTGLAGLAYTGPKSILKEAAVDLKESEPHEGVGGAGKVKIVPFELEELSIGTIKQTDVPSVVGPFPEILEHKYGFRIGGIVSHSFFRPFALTFDFENMMLRFDRR
jgi:predicted aspartyl protease